ncbi:VpsF family polysaccharide biosynthesis protein [Lysobacter sp. Hz 25]|uniref:VpsF family polysaccharide biosynthesis protein n=1 Tax=Lysobacter sp. Hz 25 TaxID=3383698 RepID=UPI0038D46DB8
MKAYDGQGSAFDRASRVFLVLSLLAYLCLSPAMLTVLGIPYDAPYGSFVFKLHPGSYLLTIALALSLAAQGNPLVALLRRLAGQPLLGLYLLAMLSGFVYSLLRYGASGSAFFIDTLMMPAAIALILLRLDAAQLRGLFRLILIVAIANAALGLVEAAMQHHLVPYTVAGGVPVIEDKFRATALLGHPLENALITSIVLLASLDRPMSPLWRASLVAFLVLALLAFGGRTSFVLTTLALLAYTAWGALHGLRAGRYGYLHIVGASIAMLLALPMAMALVWRSGLGARIFEGLYLDDSATVRLRIFSVFDHLDRFDVLFGISPAQIHAVSARVGLSANLEAIENFWLFMLLQLGVFGFAVFALGLLCAFWLLWRRAGSGGRWTLLVFLITASTTNSLASKTSALTLLFAVLCGVAGYRALGAEAAAAERRSAPRQAFSRIGARA